jgi:TP901 family phage tail tape measure protein
MDRELSLALRLYADSARMVAGLAAGKREVQGFVAFTRRELQSLRGALGSVEGKLAGIGLSFGAFETLVASARIDKSLTQIALAAGETKDETRGLREELSRMAGETGVDLQDLVEGFKVLRGDGLDRDAALQVLDATNKAMAVTGVQAVELANALHAASENFHFDLTKPKEAETLLDKMVAATRLGRANFEQIARILPQLAPQAQAAGFSFEKTIGLIEAVSTLKGTPRQTQSLSAGILQLFDLQQARNVSQLTGVHFFDNGERRDPLDVLKDLRAEFGKLKTDADRTRFSALAFSGLDGTTRHGLEELLSGNFLDKVNLTAEKLGGAAGLIRGDLGDALANAIDQGNRLKKSLKEAAEDFVKPINDLFAKGVHKLLDKPSEGGLGVTGGELLGGGAAALLGGFAAFRYGGPLLRKLAGAAGGLAEGKALEAAAGVTPVFVVNMPGGGILGSGIGVTAGDAAAAAGGGAKVFGRIRAGAAVLSTVPLGTIPALGGSALATAAGAVGAAGLAGYGVGTLISKAIEGTEASDAIGRALAHVISLASQDARDALDQDKHFKGSLKIELDAQGRARVKDLRSDSDNFDISVWSGLMFAGAPA